jgi:phage terminase large subunit-like protein
VGGVKDLSRGERAIRWIERHCRIPEGKYTGKPVRLTAHQRKWLLLIYDTPTRTFILSMGRKNAKTAFSAFLLLLHVCGPMARRNSQLYSAAQSRDQAALLFDLAAKIVRMSPDLSEVVQIRDAVKELLCPELGTFYKALSSDVATSFGKSPVFVVHDELGQVRGPRSPLFEALETAFAAQEEPLSVVISTQAPTDADLLSVLIDDALAEHDPTTKVVLHAAPIDADPFSDEAIRAANPHFDDFMNQTEVRKQAKDAQRIPTKESSYRNLILNQRVEASNPFVTRAIWMANGGAPTPAKPRMRAWGGLDLSSVADLTACVLIDEADNAWNVRPTFWLPEKGLEEKSKNDRVPYDVWRDQGYLLTTPGLSIEYEYVARFLRKEVFDKFDIQAFAFDRYNWKFLKPWLSKEGFTEHELAKFVEFGQGYVSMSPAIREFETKILSNKLRHGNHPVLAMCAANAVVMKDPAENRKFAKNKATGRIDGMVALAMAIGVLPPVPTNVPSIVIL